MKLFTNIKERLSALALWLVRRLELSSLEMMPMDKDMKRTPSPNKTDQP